MEEWLRARHTISGSTSPEVFGKMETLMKAEEDAKFWITTAKRDRVGYSATKRAGGLDVKLFF
jgi:hypothetical protein